MKDNIRDLVIELKTQVEAIRIDIKELKNGIKEQLDDHEVRLRSLESRGLVYMGGTAVVAFILVQAINLLSGSVKI